MWLTSAQVSLTGVSSNRQFFLSARVGDKQKTYAVTIDTAEARQEWVAGIQGSICKYVLPPRACTQTERSSFSPGTCMNHS